MSRTIAAVTKHRRETGITVSHAFVVTGEDECVEAAYSKGVIRSRLSVSYWPFDDRYLIFRKPRNLTDELAEQICASAEQQVGAEFDKLSMGQSLVDNTFLHYTIGQLPGVDSSDFMAKLLDDPDRYVCSELVAYVLNSQSQYRDQGVLKHPGGAIDPQRLFEDDVVFEPLRATIGNFKPDYDDADLDHIRETLKRPATEIRDPH